MKCIHGALTARRYRWIVATPALAFFKIPIRFQYPILHTAMRVNVRGAPQNTVAALLAMIQHEVAVMAGQLVQLRVF